MKLYYFDVYGRGEAIRLLLNHSGTEYEDVRMKGEEWAAMKADITKTEYGHLLVFEKDGKFLTQSNAILRLLGREYGYYPSEVETVNRIDNHIDLMGDFYTPILKVWFRKDKEEKKKEFEISWC